MWSTTEGIVALAPKTCTKVHANEWCSFVTLHFKTGTATAPGVAPTAAAQDVTVEVQVSVQYTWYDYATRHTFHVRITDGYGCLRDLPLDQWDSVWAKAPVAGL